MLQLTFGTSVLLENTVRSSGPGERLRTVGGVVLHAEVLLDAVIFDRTTGEMVTIRSYIILAYPAISFLRNYTSFPFKFRYFWTTSVSAGQTVSSDRPRHAKLPLAPCNKIDF